VGNIRTTERLKELTAFRKSLGQVRVSVLPWLHNCCKPILFSPHFGTRKSSARLFVFWNGATQSCLLSARMTSIGWLHRRKLIMCCVLTTYRRTPSLFAVLLIRAKFYELMKLRVHYNAHINRPVYSRRPVLVIYLCGTS
jgi:hypothetical protein